MLAFGQGDETTVRKIQKPFRKVKPTHLSSFIFRGGACLENWSAHARASKISMRNTMRTPTTLWAGLLKALIIPVESSQFILARNVIFLLFASFLISHVVDLSLWALGHDDQGASSSSDTLFSSSERHLDRWKRQSALASFVLWQVGSMDCMHACVRAALRLKTQVRHLMILRPGLSCMHAHLSCMHAQTGIRVAVHQKGRPVSLCM
jgi:hypothetical protein